MSEENKTEEIKEVSFDLKKVATRSLRFKQNGIFHILKKGTAVSGLKTINAGKEIELKPAYVQKVLKNLGAAANIWFISKAEYDKRKVDEEAKIEENKIAIKKANKK